MPKLDRYLLSDFTQSFLATLIVLLVVSVGGVLVDILGNIADGRIPARLQLRETHAVGQGLLDRLIERQRQNRPLLGRYRSRHQLTEQHQDNRSCYVFRGERHVFSFPSVMPCDRSPDE